MSEINKLCEKWIDNPNRNPYNGKVLKSYDEEYNNYVELCSQLGYKKDIGEMFARERLYRERERERSRMGEKKLPPRITNSPEKPTRQYLRPSVTIPVLKPAIPVPRRTVTPTYYYQEEEQEEAEEEGEEEEEKPSGKKDYGYYFPSEEEEDFVNENDYYL